MYVNNNIIVIICLYYCDICIIPEIFCCVFICVFVFNNVVIVFDFCMFWNNANVILIFTSNSVVVVVCCCTILIIIIIKK
eukprot:UN03719